MKRARSRVGFRPPGKRPPDAQYALMLPDADAGRLDIACAAAAMDTRRALKRRARGRLRALKLPARAATGTRALARCRGLSIRLTLTGPLRLRGVMQAPMRAALAYAALAWRRAVFKTLNRESP